MDKIAVLTVSKPNYVDNLINIRHETRRYFISKGQEYLKGKINELATNRARILETCIETYMNFRWLIFLHTSSLL